MPSMPHVFNLNLIIMKKTLLIAFGLTLFFASASAQHSGIFLGVKGDVNLSFFTADIAGFRQPGGPFADYHKFVRASPALAITADYVFNESNFSMATELKFNTRGGAYRIENDAVIVIRDGNREQAYNNFTFRVNYLELPLMAKYKFSESPHTSWFAYGGVSPAWKITSNTKYTNLGGNNQSTFLEERNKDGNLYNVRSFNMNVLGGVQLSSPMGNRSFYVDIRAAYGLLPVFNTDHFTDGTNARTHMFTGSAGIGYRF